MKTSNDFGEILTQRLPFYNIDQQVGSFDQPKFSFLDQFSQLSFQGFQSGPGRSLLKIRKLSVTLGPSQKLEFSDETFPGLTEFHLKVENLDSLSLDHLEKVRTELWSLDVFLNPQKFEMN